MTKKSFSKLGQGAEKFTSNLEAFLIQDDNSQEKIETPILEITKEIEDQKKTPEVKRVVKKVVKKEAPVITKAKPEIKTKAITPPKVQKVPAKQEKKVKPVSVVKVKPPVMEAADDYRTHSILFSEQQLSKVQEKVLMRKIHSDRKYSMKMAMNEAFSLWLSQKEIVVTEYPEDFKTYTALFSQKQLDDVLDRVYMFKAKKDRGYSLKKALYEAVELYLNS